MSKIRRSLKTALTHGELIAGRFQPCNGVDWFIKKTADDHTLTHLSAGQYRITLDRVRNVISANCSIQLPEDGYAAPEWDAYQTFHFIDDSNPVNTYVDFEVRFGEDYIDLGKEAELSYMILASPSEYDDDSQ